MLPCPFVPDLQLRAGGVMAKMAVLRGEPAGVLESLADLLRQELTQALRGAPSGHEQVQAWPDRPVIRDHLLLVKEISVERRGTGTARLLRTVPTRDHPAMSPSPAPAVNTLSFLLNCSPLSSG